MATTPPPAADAPASRPLDPFRRAVLRGLGVLLPPLLTIVIFLWVGNTVAKYVFEPLEDWVGYLQVEYTADILTADELPDGAIGQSVYTPIGDEYVPTSVYDSVRERLGAEPMPETARGVYRRHVEEGWLLRRFAFLAIFILALYLLGKFLAAGIGRFFWNRFEAVIEQVPLVRNVYSSVKQVTDFLFTEPDLEYTRVVAVEYPRKGIWTVAFVTGESMLDIETAANEPVMTVLIPTSPMPFTGFTITVKKSEAVDLNLSVDQAFQFVVSCGVVVPPQQLTNAVAQRGAERVAGGDGPVAPMPATLAARTVSDE